MSSNAGIERTIAKVRCTTSAATDARILADAAAILRRPDEHPRITTRRWTRLAAAAAFMLVAGLVIVLFARSTPSAYALEQTLEANRGLTYAHARWETSTEHGWEASETWLQLDEAGELVRLRMELSHADDGPKVVVWEDGKATVWFKERDVAVVVAERDMPAYLQELRAQVDPTVTMQFLHDARAAGKIVVQTIEPVEEGDPIQVVATFPDEPGWTDVFLIDAETKLVTTVESSALQDGARRIQRRVEYLEYGQPPASDVFELDLPEGVTFIDQTIQEIGLPQGDQTDEEVAVEVAREFCGALVDGAHDRAGRLFEGVPSDRVPEFARLLFDTDTDAYVRVLRVGEATRDSEYAVTAFLCVPCELEALRNGETVVVRAKLGVRPVHDRPDRWTVAGTCDD